MSLIKLFYAKIFDEKGDFLINKSISKLDKTFSFKDKAYNIEPNKCSLFNHNGIIFKKTYYLYNISNPNPILLDKKSEPILNPELYNVMLETKTAQKLNNLSSKRFNLDFKTILIIGASLVVIYLLATGQLF